MNYRNKVKVLNCREFSNLHSYLEEIINNLPPDALKELLDGYDQDIDSLFDDIMIETHNIFNNNEMYLREFGGLTSFEKHFDEQMKILSYNYFKTTCLPNFDQGWRNIEWGNLVQVHPWSAYLASRSSGKSFEFCYAFPLWRLYRYSRPLYLQRDTYDNKNSKETVIITNESTLGKEHLKKIVSELYENDILKEKLGKGSGDGSEFGKEELVTKTGSRIMLRSKESKAIRGIHVGGVMVDDFLDKSVIFSREQREKAWTEKFLAEIIPIVEPYGYLIVSGTPFHQDDMYAKLKKDKRFKVFEYPAIYPDGSLLAPDRLSWDELKSRRGVVGTLVFSREYLVKPITDAASIFPYEYLNRALIGMENISFVQNIESFPVKMERVVIGCDFAISGNIGADYTVYTVWGRDSMNNYYLLHIWRKQGASHNEQVNRIIQLDSAFKPNKIIAENNGFQRILLSMVEQRGLKHIEPFTTDKINKRDLYTGLPSLSALFERGNIKIPYLNGATSEMTDTILGEFNSISFDEDRGKLESVSDHDDIPMSCFFAISDLRSSMTKFNISWI